jgi:hypothetical protein
MSEVYGQDLTWFFDEWVLQPNHPVYANEYWIDDQGSGQWQVGFVAIQTQSNTTFHKMPIEIKVHFSTGSDTTMRVMNDSNNQIFTFEFNRQPLNVYFDPDNNIVLKTATLTQIPPLPVELTSFTANVRGNFVVLDWSTSTEKNNKGFEVQRKNSSAKENWQEIAFVEGNGTSTEPHTYSYTDHITVFGQYIYRLKQVDFDGSFEYSNEVEIQSGNKPDNYSLSQNYPNPFNPATVIRFEIPEASKVKLVVYNLLGQVVKILADGSYEPGSYQKNFDAGDLSSGVYIYELRANDIVLKRKMILMK